MNHKTYSPIVHASYKPAMASADKSVFMFKQADTADFIDGIYSMWPKAKAVFSAKEVATSTAAKGDDDIMSTAAPPAKS